MSKSVARGSLFALPDLVPVLKECLFPVRGDRDQISKIVPEVRKVIPFAFSLGERYTSLTTTVREPHEERILEYNNIFTNSPVNVFEN